MSQGPQQTVVVQQSPGTSGLGLAGLVFSILGWFTCGLLCIPGAALSFLGLFTRGSKGAAIAGLIVGFPGVIFFVVIGMGIIGGVLGIGGAAVSTAHQAAGKARKEAEVHEQNVEQRVEPVDESIFELEGDMEPTVSEEAEAETDEDVSEVTPSAEADTKPEPVADGQATDGARYIAKQAAEKLLAPLLVSPATAVYPWEEIHSTQVPCRAPGRAWHVRGVVDAKNALGVPLRHRWEAYIFEQEDKLFPIYLEMEGRVVFGNAAVLAEAGITTVAEAGITTVAEKPEPKAPAYRQWTDASGTHTVEAEFKGMIGDQVKLVTPDGRTIKLSFDQLDASDQKWIKDRK